MSLNDVWPVTLSGTNSLNGLPVSYLASNPKKQLFDTKMTAKK